MAVLRRFEGVGMRWCEGGLDALLNLWLAWVIQRFDDFFLLMQPSPPLADTPAAACSGGGGLNGYVYAVK